MFFSRGKEKPLKHASKILKDKANWCNKCQLERINNRAEGCYVCTNCGECEFFFLQLIIEIYQAGEKGNIHIQK